MDYLISWKHWLFGSSNPKFELLRDTGRYKIILEKTRKLEQDPDGQNKITNLIKNLDDDIEIISQFSYGIRKNPTPQDVELMKAHKIKYNSILSESAKLGFLGS